MSNLVDSGERRVFDSGAVRDIQDGKGRCDLLPLEPIAMLYQNDTGMSEDVLTNIECFVHSGLQSDLSDAITAFIIEAYAGVTETAILELAKHYEDGAKKYSARNWERGIPLHCYIDSALRHYFKFRRRDHDEPHDRAVLWNLFGAWWTLLNRPDLDDITGDNKYRAVKQNG